MIHQMAGHVKRQANPLLYRHQDRPYVTVNVPYHAGQTVKPSVSLRLLDQAGLSVEELRDLL